jgi:hypothetical protein
VIMRVSVLKHRQSLNREDTRSMTPPSVEYREIPLSGGHIAYVSPHRFDEINQFKWSAAWDPTTRAYRACRHSQTINGKRTTIFMHRQILGLEVGDPREGDHRDRTRTLDNTDANLRIVDQAQQAHNKGKYRNNKSGYKGVSYNSRDNVFQAWIGNKGKRRYLGSFSVAAVAYEAYCAAARELWGEHACLE